MSYSSFAWPNNSARMPQLTARGRRVIPVQRGKNCHLMTKFWKNMAEQSQVCLMPRWSLFGQASSVRI